MHGVPNIKEMISMSQYFELKDSFSNKPIHGNRCYSLLLNQLI